MQVTSVAEKCWKWYFWAPTFQILGGGGGHAPRTLYLLAALPFGTLPTNFICLTTLNLSDSPVCACQLHENNYTEVLYV